MRSVSAKLHSLKAGTLLDFGQWGRFVEDTSAFEPPAANVSGCALDRLSKPPGPTNADQSVDFRSAMRHIFGACAKLSISSFTSYSYLTST